MRVSRGLNLVQDSRVSCVGISIRAPKWFPSRSFQDEARGPNEFLLEVDHAVRDSPSVHGTITVYPDVMSITVGKHKIADDAVKRPVDAFGDVSVDDARGDLGVESAGMINGLGAQGVSRRELELATDGQILPFPVNGRRVIRCHDSSVVA